MHILSARKSLETSTYETVHCTPLLQGVRCLGGTASQIYMASATCNCALKVPNHAIPQCPVKRQRGPDSLLKMDASRIDARTCKDMSDHKTLEELMTALMMMQKVLPQMGANPEVPIAHVPALPSPLPLRAPGYLLSCTPLPCKVHNCNRASTTADGYLQAR
jgi:hypothetical protein